MPDIAPKPIGFKTASVDDVHFVRFARALSRRDLKSGANLIGCDIMLASETAMECYQVSCCARAR